MTDNPEARVIALNICLTACMYKMSPHDWSEIAVNLNALAKRFRTGEVKPREEAIEPSLVEPVINALVEISASMNDDASRFAFSK